MAVRWRRYFKDCKPIQCSGKRSKGCPTNLPRKANGAFKTCGVWCIEFFDSNKEWQSLTFKDVHCKTDAEKRFMMFIADRERSRLNLPKSKRIPMLSAYIKTYLSLQKGVTENTRLMKERACLLLEKHLGCYALDKITPFIIEKFRIARKEKDGVKDSSINIDVQVLSHLFSTAVNSGLIEKNPCKNVKKFKMALSKDRILSGQEITLLLDRLEGKDRLMVQIGLFTGMRLNEVLKLQWGDISFVKHLITFTQSKTGKLLVIPFPNYLADALLRYRSNLSGFNDNSRLFEAQEITHKVVSAYSTRFTTLFRQSGVADFGFHGLRHSFASLQGDFGTGAVAIKELLGHSDLAMTTRYAHGDLSIKKKATQLMEDHVLSILKESKTTAMQA